MSAKNGLGRGRVSAISVALRCITGSASRVPRPVALERRRGILLSPPWYRSPAGPGTLRPPAGRRGPQPGPAGSPWVEGTTSADSLAIALPSQIKMGLPAAQARAAEAQLGSRAATRYRRGH